MSEQIILAAIGGVFAGFTLVMAALALWSRSA